MALDTLAIMNGIRNVVLGTAGSVRTLDVDDAKDGQSMHAADANKAIALTRPAFDITLASSKRSTASPLSASAGIAVKEMDVHVELTFAFDAPVQRERRYIVRADANDLCERIAQALSWPGNLTTDGEGSPTNTGLVSGMLFGPGDEPIPTVSIDEDWEKQRLIANINARAQVIVDQETA